MAKQKEVKFPRTVKLVAWHDGDRTVGIYGDSATIELEVYDEDFLRAAKEVLTEAFTTLWDFRAHVETEDYFADDEDG
jgi:hypothetical protein